MSFLGVHRTKKTGSLVLLVSIAVSLIFLTHQASGEDEFTRNATSPELVGTPIFYSVSVARSLSNMVPDLNVWPLSELKSSVDGALASKLGIYNIHVSPRQVVNNSESAKQMAKAYKEIIEAQKEIGEDNNKALKEVCNAMYSSVDAYLLGLSELTEVSQKADHIGLDKYEYSGFAGLEASKSLDNIIRAKKELATLSEKYSNNRIEKIKTSAKELEDELTNITNPLKTSTPQIAMMGAYHIINTLDQLFKLMDIGQYYNAIFSPAGVYGKIMRTEDRLKKAIDSMYSDYESMKKDYSTIDVKRPDIAFRLDVVREKIPIHWGCDPEAHLIAGDNSLEQSKAMYNSAERTRHSEYMDDYLYLAITKMNKAIDTKRAAADEYKSAAKCDYEITRTIRHICELPLKTNNELAKRYYKDGKAKCESKDPQVVLEGAREVWLANTWTGEDLLARIIDLERGIKTLMNKAKRDGIDVGYEEEKINEVDRNINDLVGMDKETAMEQMQRLMDELMVIKREIENKVYERYKGLIDYSEILEGMNNTDGLTDTVSNYTDLIERVGELSDIEKEYKQKLEDAKRWADLEIEKLTDAKFAICNKTMSITVRYRIYNPNPISIEREINLDGKQIQLVLGPEQEKILKLNKDVVLARCTTTKIGQGGIHEVYLLEIKLSAKPITPIRVYLTGDLAKLMSPELRKDKYGVYVPNIYSDTKIMLFTPNIKGTVFQNGSNNSTSAVEGAYSGNVGGNTEDVGKLNVTKSEHKTKESAYTDRMNQSQIAEYYRILSILKKNRNCTSLDIGWLGKNPTEDKLQLMKDEYMSLRRTAVLLGEGMVDKGYDEEYIKNKIREGEFCEIIKAKGQHVSDGERPITGRISSESLNWFLPIIAFLFVVYIARGKKENRGRRDRIRRILKSIEEDI